MNKFQKFLESIEEADPKLVKGIAEAYAVIMKSRDSVTEDLGSTLSGIGELEQGNAAEEQAGAEQLAAEKIRPGNPSTDTSSIAESQDTSTTENDPMVEEDADQDYAEQGVARVESLSAAGNACMKKMKKLVEQHGYWSEPVKSYSAEMENDTSLTPDDRATVHSTHMNMY